ncbi:MAG: phosphoribosylglycinamide formyltransferase [Gammaproteobacteria bacterium]|nr:phosphoribosylglycinamide formyltransferase [Gammaproteobacteria bacterium]
MPENHDFSIVVLISGRGSNLQAIIDAVQGGEIPGRISAVISNRAEAYGLERAHAAGIPTEVLDHKRFPNRESFDTALMARIDDYAPDLVVLAGFMRILSDGFVEHYAGCMINIHPSLLPRYRGLNTHQRAIEAGDDWHGCSVHFVTPELDGGPVLLQGRVPIEAGDDAERLADRVHVMEHRIYPMAVAWIAQGRARLVEHRIQLDGKPLAEPVIQTLDD